MIAEHRSAFSVGNVRRTAFYVAVVGALAVYGTMMRDLLPLVVTAWVVDVGAHRLHDLNFLALVWVGILGLGLQLYRSGERVTAAVASVLVMAPLAIFAVTSGLPIAPMPILFTGLGLVVVALHPAGRSLLHLDRVQPVDRGLLGLLALAAGPLAIYAAHELGRQYAVADDHAALVHYGGMAVVAAFVFLMGVLATVRRRDWRFAGWSAGGLAVYLGASSVAFPGLESSVGPVWGGLAVVWGVGFVAAVEVTRRGATTRVERSIELDASPETVWEVLNDFDRMPEWVAFADELTYLSEGDVGEGTVYREYGGVGPMRDESEWRIVEFDRPHRQVHVGDLGIMRPKLTMTLEPANGTTRFTQAVEFRALPLVRPVGWLLEQLVIKRAMRSGLRESQRNLQRLVAAEDRAAA